jgi:hypothetical protein
MKYIIVLALCFANVVEIYSQSLIGIWEGWFLYSGNRKDTAIIKLDFRLNSDSTYDVYSFTYERDIKAVCKMTYRMLGPNSIYLEEVRTLKTNKQDRVGNFQTMNLKIGKEFKSMSGRWFCAMKELYCGGRIYFSRKQ